VRRGDGVGDEDPTVGVWDGNSWQLTGFGLRGAKRLMALRPLLCCACGTRLRANLIDPPVVDDPPNKNGRAADKAPERTTREG